MSAVYALFKPFPGETGAVFAVVADDTGARYVFSGGDDTNEAGLNSDRIGVVRSFIDASPSNALEWFGVAAYALGNVVPGPLTAVDTLDEAVARATEAIEQEPTYVSVQVPPPPSFHVPQTQAERLAFQRQALDEWAQQYPEAAAGDVDDPEADLALAHLMTPPVDPERPHTWLPIATTETDCGFCDLPEDAPIHVEAKDTITRGPD